MGNNRILGLDLGTNSIGWALIEQNAEEKQGKILGMGSRIIPMTQDVMDKFGAGAPTETQTAERTGFRGVRRLRERFLLRRERLHRVLNLLGFLPAHYAAEIDFVKRLGKFKDETEPKLAWKKNEQGKFEFLFQKSFDEMAADFKANGQDLKIPYDWTIYYLRKKALTQKLEKEELAWLILNFNQKRGYYQLRGEEEEDNPNKLVEFYSLKIVDVKAEVKYNLILENGKTYYRTSETPLLNWKDEIHTFVVTTYLEKDGSVKKDKEGKDEQSFFLKQDLENIKSKSKKKKINAKLEEKSIRIVDVKEEKQDKIWYSLTLENGWVYRRESAIDLSTWKDRVREFIVTTDLNDDESVKKDNEGKESRSFRSPKEDDWTLLKKKTENVLENYIAENQSQKTVGTYIYDTLLQNPKQKIKGKLVRTIERKFYKDELKQILTKQVELQPELFTDDLLNDCIRELYRNNEAHQQILQSKDFVHLFLNDVIFYQRPLRSQKSSIGNCTLEYRKYKDENGVEQTQYLKAIPKSNPYYQEFRLLQWIFNLSIYKKDDDTNVTNEFLNSTEDYQKLFDFLNDRKEIEQAPLIEFLLKQKLAFKKVPKAEIEKYRWNYVNDKKYPCNETKTLISTRLAKVENIDPNFLTREIEQKLWHIIYSVNDKIEYEKALKSFANKNGLDESSFVEAFRKFPPFKSEYGSFSEKAIKKLLPLMRFGKYWNENEMIKNSDVYFKNIEKLLGILAQKEEDITDEDRKKYNKTINHKLREELEVFQNAEIQTFQGLRLHIAQYLVYGRHSEASYADKWNSVEDLKKYLEDFKQHSLRNPIVEQVVTETLRVVKDIWEQYGRGAKDFFDEIHIELGREMKNTADDRKKITNQVTENENTNLRIKALLAEMNDMDVENVRPYSPMQQEILKIYEEGVLNSDIEIEEEYLKISKTAQPSSSDLKKYKLWLEQKYKSPYTGQIIPLNKLFTPEYEIEHIIPQSRYFDDSMSNKVICEAAVNTLKGNKLGMEFIKKPDLRIVETGFGNTVTILSVQEYEEFVKKHYDKNRGKRNKLLMEEIPEKMIERQMNDTRYISKFISGLLSNIVRDENNDDGVNSKYIIPGNGKITTTLRQDWGLNDVWNDLILPRFERMNELTKTKDYTAWNDKHQKDLPTIPIELSKGFSKKRIDHRHHAMDALVVACATRDHVNLLNNQSAKSDLKRYDLQYKLRLTEKWVDKDGKEKDKFIEFKKPWNTFTQEARNALENIVVSFKQNLRVINKATNRYEKYVEKNGEKKKELVEQKGTNWAIRKPMHQSTVFGKVYLQDDVKEVSLKKALELINQTNDINLIVDKNIRKIISPFVLNGTIDVVSAIKDEKLKDVLRLKVFEQNVATRFLNDVVSVFNGITTVDKAKEKIEKVTDTGIRKILINHLENKGNRPEIAFSSEGLEDMNKNINFLNNGKFHHPIYKVRMFQALGNKFPIGFVGNKKDKYVVAEAGTNLFFIVYEKNGKRNYSTLPLSEVIEHQKWRSSLSTEEQKKVEIVPIEKESGKFLYYLCPNDLVYLPTNDELENPNGINFNNLSKDKKKNIYKVVSFSGSRLSVIPYQVATAIVNKVEYTQANKIEFTKEKEIMVKLNVDRLGNTSK